MSRVLMDVSGLATLNLKKLGAFTVRATLVVTHEPGGLKKGHGTIGTTGPILFETLGGPHVLKFDSGQTCNIIVDHIEHDREEATFVMTGPLFGG